ncbi:MAG: hypothetical protein BZ138_07895 [Methanosphaera sp. rholeuAM270]|nr:MAG: hypothetical protein BZ138_07895 [Methanosphaera sp. rholeuAM270]
MMSRKIRQEMQRRQHMTSKQVIAEIEQIEMLPSLLVMSGGLDTTTLLYLLNKFRMPLEVISFDYGQDAVKEIEIAHYHCEQLHVKHHIVKISETYVAGMLGNDSPKENHSYTIVPNRNGIFLNIATSYALQNGLSRVYYGAHGDIDPCYCDCSPEYIHQFNITSLLCDIREVQVRAPFINKTKEDILQTALSLGVDLTKTWTCYENGEQPCGTCGGCEFRKRIEKEYVVKYSSRVREVEQSLRNYLK